MAGSPTETCAINADKVHLVTTAANPNVNLATLECVGWILGGQGRVGGDFTVHNKTSSSLAVSGLQTLTATTLRAVQGGLRVATGEPSGPPNALTQINLQGLGTLGQGLPAVPGALQLEKNDLLVSINLGALAQINGGVTISFNDVLPNLGPLWPVSVIAGELSVSNNDSLTNLASLALVAQVQGATQITDNDALPNLWDLGALNWVWGVFEVLGNQVLTNATLTNLRTVGGTWIRSNPAMTVLSFPVLQTVDHVFHVEKNGALATLNIPQLLTIGDLYRYEQNNLVGLTAFNMLGPPGTVCGTWGWIEAFTSVPTDPSFAPLSALVGPGLCFPPIPGCVLGVWQEPSPSPCP